MNTSTTTTSPHKIGLQSKNPFGDFTKFEQNVDDMKPLVPEQTADQMQFKIKKLATAAKKSIHAPKVV